VVVVLVPTVGLPFVIVRLGRVDRAATTKLASIALARGGRSVRKSAVEKPHGEL
jgi:hypothetical protein